MQKFKAAKILDLQPEANCSKHMHTQWSLKMWQCLVNKSFELNTIKILLIWQSYHGYSSYHSLQWSSSDDPSKPPWTLLSRENIVLADDTVSASGNSWQTLNNIQNTDYQHLNNLLENILWV